VVVVVVLDVGDDGGHGGDGDGGVWWCGPMSYVLIEALLVREVPPAKTPGDPLSYSYRVWCNALKGNEGEQREAAHCRWGSRGPSPSQHIRPESAVAGVLRSTTASPRLCVGHAC
jgi:hypothetical protein